ncbi:hypothetical protein BDN70DRAFT_833082 [Pholiota conissans]|uniref:Protein-S-isoprenylcysteine O-methyltransferase n=1 Tax=Pholiota conissans TaxID=109636 RepID=A0A9P5Z5A6_9AGAR|nr:hypothetical protein BDN70DRAFT_833082 [Pholiota conissans]
MLIRTQCLGYAPIESHFRAMLFPSLLIVFVAIGIHVSVTPPAPAPPMERQKLNDFSMLLSRSIEFYKYSCWIHCALEIITLILPTLLNQFPQSPSVQWVNTVFFDNFFLLPSSAQDRTIFFPSLRLFGAFLVLAGSIIRYIFYCQLGRHFTFQVAFLEDHRLVTTGPYSIVRHPAYTGGITMKVGVLLWHATPGSWLWQSRFYTKTVAWFGILPTLFAIISILITIAFLRPNKEDDMLKKEFGRKWDGWASEVPYRLVPGVY